jgi:hypothetical protein
VLVSISFSETYDVPPGDEISTPLLLAEWMRARSLLGANARIAHSAQVQSNGLYRLRLRDVKMANI